MNTSLAWIKAYVPDLDVEAQEFADAMTLSGSKVEGYEKFDADLDKIIIGQIVKIEKHPDADKLIICQVNIGQEEPVQIVTGAPNVKEGDKVPVVLDGGRVAGGHDGKKTPGGIKIKKGKLRGYESCGMLCSGTELGLTEDLYPGAGYNGLLVLPEDAEIGADVKPLLQLDDWIFDIAITANRPDCESIFGIAREVAAILNKPVKTPALDYTESGVTKDGFTVTVDAPDLCPRYIAHYVTDVKIGESPAWMKRRLALVGIGSISNVVDITNYILKELGQPMHAFDSSYIEGNAIHVRRAHDKEKIVTLDEKEFELNENNLVICDGVKPVALAGIMGGLNSEIRDTTEAVIFESAKFARDNIRKSSRALGQSSDSSQRYAKGVDEYATVMASKRALHLIEELGCGKVSSTHVEANTGNSIEPTEMKASIKKVNGVLGIEVPTADIERILKSLNFQPVINGDELTIQVPAYREDMESYPDIAEEVIRMYGYDHVTPTFLKAAAVTSGGMNTKQKTELKIKRALCAQGAFEGVHYSFFSPSDLNLLGLPEDAPERHAIRLINPINEDLSLMRTTLAPQMIHAIARNQKNGCLEGRVYEIGNKFIPKDLPLTEYPDERETICIGIWGKEENFFTLKGLVDTVAETLFIDFEYVEDKKSFLHPYRTAKILYNGEEIGYLGQLTYEIQKEEDMRESAYVAEIDLKALRPVYGKVPTFTPISKFAKETRDLALVMNKSVTCGEVEKAIAEASSFVESVELFDVYEGLQVGPEKKSMAFTVTFAPKEEEFTTEAVDGYVKKILKNLNNKLGVELRS